MRINHGQCIKRLEDMIKGEVMHRGRPSQESVARASVNTQEPPNAGKAEKRGKAREKAEVEEIVKAVAKRAARRRADSPGEELVVCTSNADT